MSVQVHDDEGDDIELRLLKRVDGEGVMLMGRLVGESAWIGFLVITQNGMFRVQLEADELQCLPRNDHGEVLMWMRNQPTQEKG